MPDSRMLFHSWICRPLQLSRWDFILRDAGLYGTAWKLSIGAEHEKSFSVFAADRKRPVLHSVSSGRREIKRIHVLFYVVIA